MALVMVYKTPGAKPTISNVVVSGTAKIGETLTCTYDVTGATSSSIVWYSYTDDDPETGETQIGTGVIYQPLAADEGKFIRARVFASNSVGTSEADSALTAAVVPADPPGIAPVLVAPAEIIGTLSPGQVVSVTYDFTGETSVTFAWTRYDSEDKVNPHPLGVGDSVLLSNDEAGKWIGVDVRGANEFGYTDTSDLQPMVGVDPYQPVAPEQYDVPAYDISGMEMIYCNDGDNLQAKLDELRPGKCLVLEAGASWTGQFRVKRQYLSDPNEASWAYIISSDVASLPAGVRVTPDDAVHMPKIKGPTAWSTARAATSLSRVGTVATITYSSTSGYVPLNGTITIQGANEPGWNGDFTVLSTSSTQATFAVPDDLPEPTGSIQWKKIYGMSRQFGVEDGVNKVRIVGVEITTEYEALNDSEVHYFSCGKDPTADTRSYYGEDIVLDRCYIHGNPGSRSRDGIVLYRGAGKVAIINSHISDFKGRALESHGIHVFETLGPVLIENNHISACAINVFIGDNATVPSYRPVENVSVIGNHIYKPLEWCPHDPSYNGLLFLQKNMLEIKSGKKVLIRGNKMENAWLEDQSGAWMTFITYGGSIEDVEVRDNYIINGCNCYVAGVGSLRPVKRVKIHNNLWVSTHSSSKTTGIGINGSSTLGIEYLSFEHNTFVPPGTWFTNLTRFVATPAAGPDRMQHLRIRNNIMRAGSDGTWTNNGPPWPTDSRTMFETYCTDDYEVTDNVFIGATSTVPLNSGDVGGFSGAYDRLYRPSSNASVGFTNTALSDFSHYVLQPTSAYYAAGSDGEDLGCDIAALTAQLNDPF